LSNQKAAFPLAGSIKAPALNEPIRNSKLESWKKWSRLFTVARLPARLAGNSL
jgi:hypothetical protein